MKKFVYGALTPIVLIVSACSQTGPTVPKCSDERVIKMVQEIIAGELDNTFSAVGAIESIRTTNTNPTTGAHDCAAGVELKLTEGARMWPSKHTPFNCSVEVTDDGESIIVGVSNLPRHVW